MLALRKKEHDHSGTPFITRALNAYPVTFLVVGPYAAFIIPLATYHGNPKTSFVYYLIGLVLLAAGLIETAFLGLRPTYPTPKDAVIANSRYPRILRIARPVAVLNMAAEITSAASGGGTIFTQVTGRAASNPLVALTTPLAGWRYVAVALFASAFLGGLMPKREFFQWIGAMVATQLVVAVFMARVGAFASFIAFLIIAGLIFNLIRARAAFVVLAILFIAWPTMFEIRNEIREAGGVSVTTDDANDRLRVDLQVTRVTDFEIPAEIQGTIGLEEVLRYGLIPRVLDKDRPLLSTGYAISYFLDGNITNAYTFLPVATNYFFNGPNGLMIYYGCWAMAFVLLLKTGNGPGPIRIVFVLFAIAGPLDWAAVFPDALVVYLQNLVGAAPVMAALHLLGRAPEADA